MFGRSGELRAIRGMACRACDHQMYVPTSSSVCPDSDLAFGASPRLPDVIGLGVLTRVVDRDTVDDVLSKANRHQTRVRLLPARVVVYLVLALCPFTSDGYDEVVRKLTNVSTRLADPVR